jgi:hypothetical protein
MKKPDEDYLKYESSVFLRELGKDRYNECFRELS